MWTCLCVKGYFYSVKGINDLMQKSHINHVSFTWFPVEYCMRHVKPIDRWKINCYMIFHAILSWGVFWVIYIQYVSLTRCVCWITKKNSLLALHRYYFLSLSSFEMIFIYLLTSNAVAFVSHLLPKTPINPSISLSLFALALACLKRI